jgi:cobalt-precorrin-5B (C1)-methyltransferase
MPFERKDAVLAIMIVSRRIMPRHKVVIGAGFAKIAGMDRRERTNLRRGWTTGACATAAARAAFAALAGGIFPDPVTIRLPRGGSASFPLALRERNGERARAGVVKDAGDDPDVTHGACVIADVAWAAPGSGIGFAAGDGVGTVSRPGLPLAVGEPAINPAPRLMICEALLEVAEERGMPPPDLVVTISIPGGERLAAKTANPRLGIVGGLSVLGTTGIVIPYSCASWIHSIHRGIDVARAAGLSHIAAAPGAVSERAVQRLYGLPDHALIDMGDFVGGMLKYLRRHPVARLTLAGGFAKMAKLAQGHLDLHSQESRVDRAALAEWLATLGAGHETSAAARNAAGAGEILALAGSCRRALAERVAARAREVALATLAGKTAVETAIIDRSGEFLARVGG